MQHDCPMMPACLSPLFFSFAEVNVTTKQHLTDDNTSHLGFHIQKTCFPFNVSFCSPLKKTRDFKKDFDSITQARGGEVPANVPSDSCMAHPGNQNASF